MRERLQHGRKSGERSSALELCVCSKCGGYARKVKAEMSEEAEPLINSDVALATSPLENGGSREVNCHSGFQFFHVLFYFDKRVKKIKNYLTKMDVLTDSWN